MHEIVWALELQTLMAESLAILKMAKEEPDKIINSRLEIYGSCRHETRFDRYTMNGLTSTDDGDNPERALGDSTNANDTKPKPPPSSDLKKKPLLNSDHSLLFNVLNISL